MDAPPILAGRVGGGYPPVPPLEEERRDRQTVRVNFAGAQGFPTEIELLLLTGEVMTLMSTAVAGFSIWN